MLPTNIIYWIWPQILYIDLKLTLRVCVLHNYFFNTPWMRKSMFNVLGYPNAAMPVSAERKDLQLTFWLLGPTDSLGTERGCGALWTGSAL